MDSKQSLHNEENAAMDSKQSLLISIEGTETDHSNKSNKISDIVKLKRMLKKWRLQANSAQTCSNRSNSKTAGSLSRSNSKGTISFLKRTLSFTDISPNAAGAPSPNNNTSVPKGFLAVDVGEEMKRFIIPTNYLSHPAIQVLLKQAEEEFGFQQEGVLRIPCEPEMFATILKMVEPKSNAHLKHKHTVVQFSRNEAAAVCGSSSEGQIPQSFHPQSSMCR